ncbi:rhomboid family intramembrane serine protease [Alienimonas sp. DA493]|uniref:rhomboid family intramembrane serine protease n=1 Tax=Alienimonas sp. DA493 TaxID=3373605 RepID=UPI003754A09E
MRLLVELPPDRAARLTDVLVASGVPAQFRPDESVGPGAGDAAVWVVEEDDLETAQRTLAAFLDDPDADRFVAASAEADRLRAAAEKERKAAAKRFRRGRDTFRDAASGAPLWKRAPVCAGLIAVCCLVAAFGWGGTDDPWSLWSRQEPLIHWLWITENSVVPLRQGWVRIEFDTLGETLARGELWRPFTPALLHANPIHLAFNMSWLVGLGAILEGRFGWWRFLLGVLAVAGLSNVAEYYADMRFGLPVLGLFDFQESPRFGGFSGVAVALFGFEVGRKRGGRPLTTLSTNSTFFMLAFLVLCLSGSIIAVANVAHFSGLALGFGAGFISAKREGRPHRSLTS